MLVSFCIPVHNRTYDLKKTMPHLLEAANACPPVEIVILDYNSPDDLPEYLEGVLGQRGPGVDIVHARYSGCAYYRMAHARNLSVLAASGEYITILSADIYPIPGFLEIVRQMIAKGNYTWLYDKRYSGVIVCRRQEFIEAGGYDERFEFYGPEDRDLDTRLRRRGGFVGIIPPGLLRVIETPNEEKVKNYRLPLSKREMHRLGMAVYEENNKAGATVTNPGGWGKWS